MFLKNQRNKIEGQNTKRIGGGYFGVYVMRQNQETYMIASLCSRRCGSYMM